MAGKIWRYDCYDLRKFDPLDISYFVDIGANVGSTSLQAKVLNPKARVISLEPTKKTFNILNINMEQWKNTGVECYNIALGDGTEMCFHDRGGECGGNNRFYSAEEKKWWPGDSYLVESKTLTQIFVDYKINTEEAYIIKVDCEGGERFLIRPEFEEESLKYIRGSVQTMLELHLGLGGLRDEWNSFINKLKDTHELRLGGWKDKNTPNRRYKYDPCEEIIQEKGNIQIELVNKEWCRRGY